MLLHLLNAGWRWLLRLDLPVPERTESEIEAEIKRNYPWNFSVNMLDVVTFWFGLNFASPSTIIPLFLSKLTLNPFIIGLAAVISQSGWYIPQLFTAGYTERLARKKPVVVNLGFFTERLPLWLWPLAAMIALDSPGLALLLFLMGHACHSLGAGGIAPAWQDLIARCFPVNRRGRFFGLSSFIGTGVGAVGAYFSGWLLKTYPFPQSFIYTFLVAALFINLSWVFLALTRESAQAVAPPQPDAEQRWAKWRRIVSHDHNFRWYLYARFLTGMGMMGLGFVTVSAIQRWQIVDSIVAFYTMSLLIGQALGNLFAGIVADRVGYKLPFEIGLFAMALAFLLAWLAPSPIFYYGVFILLGFSMGVRIVCGVMISMEFSAAAYRPTYVGLSNTVGGFGAGIAPLIGGWIAGMSYDWLFILSAVFSLISFSLFRWYIIEPRKRSGKIIFAK